jgi:hypothetical protein
MSTGFRVTETIEGAHPKHTDYPLLPGDLLVRADGTWWKEAPGLAVGGFVLSEAQEATLKPVKFGSAGLDYWVNPA